MNVSKIYLEEDVSKTVGKINNAIECYRATYRNMPLFIIISKELAFLLERQLDLMSQREMIILNDNHIEIRKIFGISCIISPTLKDLEFEVR